MKISEMNNDQATQAIIKLAQPMSNILDDPNTQTVLSGLAEQRGKDLASAIGAVLPKLASFCMKDHKKDFYEIVSALTFIPANKVGSMNFLQTIKELRDSIDKDFIDFFKRSGSMTADPGKE